MSARSWDPELGSLNGIVAALGAGTGDLYGLRLERKLVLQADQAQALRAAVAQRMDLEQYVAGRRKTLIHSIYFDSPDFLLFRRAQLGEGAMNLKLRLRAYGDARTPEQGDPGRFLEAKLGITSAEGLRLKRKARMAISDRKLASFLHDDQSPYQPRSGRRFWKPLLAWAREHSIRPCLSVAYEREAFVDPESQLRVTFDQGYRTAPVQGAASPRMGPHGTLQGVVIVELKFVQSLPAWLAAELFRLSLPVDGQSFSKFRTAVPLLFPQFEA